MISIILNIFGSEKTVNAIVKDKYVSESFSKYAAGGTTKRHMIVFAIEGKTKQFQVSEFSYDGYSINETGKLTYKGKQIIKFVNDVD